MISNSVDIVPTNDMGTDNSLTSPTYQSEKDNWEEAYLKKKAQFMEKSKNLLNKRNTSDTHNNNNSNSNNDNADSNVENEPLPIADSPTVSFNILENTLKEFDKEMSIDPAYLSDNPFSSSNYYDEITTNNSNEKPRIAQIKTQHKFLSGPKSIINFNKTSSNKAPSNRMVSHITSESCCVDVNQNNTTPLMSIVTQIQPQDNNNVKRSSSNLSSIVARKLEMKNSCSTNLNATSATDSLMVPMPTHNSEGDDVRGAESNYNTNNNIKTYEDISYFMSIIDDENDTMDEDEDDEANEDKDMNTGYYEKTEADIVNVDEEDNENNQQLLVSAESTSTSTSSSCEMCKNHTMNDEITNNNSDTLLSNISPSNIVLRQNQLKQQLMRQKCRGRMKKKIAKKANEKLQENKQNSVNESSQHKSRSKKYNFQQGLKLDELESELEKVKRELQEKNQLINEMQQQPIQPVQKPTPTERNSITPAQHQYQKQPVQYSNLNSDLNNNSNQTAYMEKITNLTSTRSQQVVQKPQVPNRHNIQHDNLNNMNSTTPPSSAISPNNNAALQLPDFDPNSTVVLKNKIRDLESQVQDLQEANEVASKFIMNYRSKMICSETGINLGQIISELEAQNNSLRHELDLIKQSGYTTNTSTSSTMVSSSKNNRNSKTMTNDITQTNSSSIYLRQELENLKVDLNNLKQQNKSIVVENIKLKQLVKVGDHRQNGVYGIENGKIGLDENVAQSNVGCTQSARENAHQRQRGLTYPYNMTQQQQQEMQLQYNKLANIHTNNHGSNQAMNAPNSYSPVLIGVENPGNSKCIQNYSKNVNDLGEIVERELHQRKAQLNQFTNSGQANFSSSSGNYDSHISPSFKAPKSHCQNSVHQNSVLVNTTSTSATILPAQKHPNTSIELISGYDILNKDANDNAYSTRNMATTTSDYDYEDDENTVDYDYDDEMIEQGDSQMTHDEDDEDLTDDMLHNQEESRVAPNPATVHNTYTSNTGSCSNYIKSNHNPHNKHHNHHQHQQPHRQIDSKLNDNTTFITNIKTTDNSGLSNTDMKIKSLSNYDNPFSTQHSFAFAPKASSELNRGDIIKFIRQGGRISKGLVHFIGILPGRNDTYIGVELELEDGKHDGVYQGVRYFKCKDSKGVFVAFNKVIMVYSKQQS